MYNLFSDYIGETTDEYYNPKSDMWLPCDGTTRYQCVRIKIPVYYRLLNLKEKIRESDEYFDASKHTWVRYGEMTGNDTVAIGCYPFRRQIKSYENV